MDEIFGWQEWYDSHYSLKIWSVDIPTCNEVVRYSDGRWERNTIVPIPDFIPWTYIPSAENLEREYRIYKREEKLKRITNV